MENKKIIDLGSENYMIVADLHANWPDYQRTKEIYQKKKEAGKVKGLIIAGDTVHPFGSKDGSKEIIDDLIKFTQEDSNVHVLLGNHEFPHIYNFFLFAGHSEEFTHKFELAIKDNREKYINFFKSLPLYARTKGGVTISHAGASKEVNKLERFEDLIELNHDDIIKENIEDSEDGFNTLTLKQKEEFKKSLEERVGMPYEEALKKARGVDPKDKEKYESLLQGEYFRRLKHEKFENPDAEWLWNMFCNGNEGEYGNFDYSNIINEFLEKMSEGYAPQNLIISGHVHSEAGFDVFEDKQLRITSSAGIIDPAAKSFVIIDAGKGYSCARDLAENIHSLYPEATDEDLLKKVEELSKKHPIKTRYNIATKQVQQTRSVNKDVLVMLGQHFAQDKIMVENGIKPKGKNLNKNLLEIIAGLERKKDNVRINYIFTDGGSFYRVSYEDLSKKEEESLKDKVFIEIGYNTVIDHNPAYGDLSIAKVQSGNGFVHVIGKKEEPVEIQFEDGTTQKGIRHVPLVSDKETVDELINNLKEEYGPKLTEEAKNAIKGLVFKRSVLEDPYTNLSEEEFFKKLSKESKASKKA